MFSAPSVASAQNEIQDYSGHPAVGIWVENDGAGFPFAYTVNHSDGTLTYYNSYPNAFSSQSPSNLPVYGFGLWRPTGERTTEGVMHIAWGDTSVQALFRIWARGELVDDDSARTEYREQEIDRSGNVIRESTGTSYPERMQWEPYELPVTPEATPGT